MRADFRRHRERLDRSPGGERNESADAGVALFPGHRGHEVRLALSPEANTYVHRVRGLGDVDHVTAFDVIKR